MKKIKKIKLNITKYRNNSFSEINQLYNKGEEEVLKLNLGKYKNKFFANGKSDKSKIDGGNSQKRYSLTFLRQHSKNIQRRLSKVDIFKNDSFCLENIEKEFSSLNDISKSIKKLQTIVPNLLEKIYSDNSHQILSAPRFQHMQYENYLHKLLKDLNKKEIIIKKNKEILENELTNIDEIIADKELSIDILINMDSFKKMYRQKIVSHYENEFNKNEEKKIELSNISNFNTTSNNKLSINLNNTFNSSNHISANNSNSIKKNSKNNGNKTIKIQHELRAKAFRAKLNNFILKNKEKSNTKAEKLKNEVSEQKINKKLICEDLQNINQKLKIIHINKKNIIDKLFIHYLTILKEGKDTRDEGLAWVICEILSLGKKVMMSFLPKYLDEKCVLYLFQMAHLIMKKKEIENKILKIRQIFSPKKKIRKSISEEIDTKIYFKSMKTLNNLREKFLRSSFILDTSKYDSKENSNKIQYSVSHPLSLRKRISSEIMEKAKKSSKNASLIFVHGDPNHYYEDNIDDIPDLKFNDIKNYTLKNKNIFKSNKEIKFEECIQLNKQMEKIKKIKEDLKNKEMCRIFEEYRKNKYYEKYNVEKDILINALVGEDNLINEMYNQKKKEKQFNDEILKIRLYKRDYIKKNIIFLNNSS